MSLVILSKIINNTLQVYLLPWVPSSNRNQDAMCGWWRLSARVLWSTGASSHKFSSFFLARTKNSSFQLIDTSHVSMNFILRQLKVVIVSQRGQQAATWKHKQKDDIWISLIKHVANINTTGSQHDRQARTVSVNPKNGQFKLLILFGNEGSVTVFWPQCLDISFYLSYDVDLNGTLEGEQHTIGPGVKRRGNLQRAT